MLTQKTIKVLIYGNIFRQERSQILYNFLLNSQYYTSLVCPDFYSVEKLGQANFLQKIFAIFHLIEFWLKAPFTDIIYLPPMNTRFIQPAVWAAKILNKKLIVEMYISLYDTLVRDRNTIKDGTQKAKAVRDQDILALSEADYIIHTAKHELSYWGKLLATNIDYQKVFIAPLCHNVSTLVHQRIQPDGEFRICWWGTFIPLHGLDNILLAMKILKEQKLNFTLNLFGVEHPLFAEYIEKIQAHELNENVLLRKDLTFAQGTLPTYLIDNCDLALGIFGNTDKADNTIPNKLVEALAMGIPTLTMNSSALKEFFTPEDVWTCERSPTQIAAAIMAIANRTAQPVNWQQTRQKVLNTFSIARYQEVVSQVLEAATSYHS